MRRTGCFSLLGSRITLKYNLVDQVFRSSSGSDWQLWGQSELQGAAADIQNQSGSLELVLKSSFTSSATRGPSLIRSTSCEYRRQKSSS